MTLNEDASYQTPAPFLQAERLLSIQSHVVSGYVGNRAGTFPLQLLGYDVDVINTVQHCNHAGYGYFEGSTATSDQLEAIFRGLNHNGLARWSKVLTGYTPRASGLNVVSREIRKLKERARGTSPPEEVVYLLDPVMGDIGKGLYVGDDCEAAYRELLKQATITTPNQFEIELLAGFKIDSISSLHRALNVLHASPYSVPNVIISSIALPQNVVESLNLVAAPQEYAALADDAKGIEPSLNDKQGSAVLLCFASTKTADDEMPQTYVFALPVIDGYFSGVGDLFSALVLGFYGKGNSAASDLSASETVPIVDQKSSSNVATTARLSPFAAAVSKALMGVQLILLKTHLWSLRMAEESKEKRRQTKDSECLEASDDEDYLPSDLELDSLPPKFVSEGASSRPSRIARRMRMRELRIVQEKEILLKLAKEEHAGWPGTRLDWTELLQGTQGAK